MTGVILHVVDGTFSPLIYVDLLIHIGPDEDCGRERIYVESPKRRRMFGLVFEVTTVPRFLCIVSDTCTFTASKRIYVTSSGKDFFVKCPPISNVWLPGSTFVAVRLTCRKPTVFTPLLPPSAVSCSRYSVVPFLNN